MDDLEEFATDVDQLNVGVSVVVDDPGDFRLHRIDINNSLKILTQNIRSLNKNFNGLEVFLARTTIEYDVIILTECWLQNSDFIPDLENYNYYSTTRHFNQNSGVVVYVRQNVLDVSVYEPMTEDSDCLIVQIGIHYSLICVYRSPSLASPVAFQNSIDSVLQNLKHVPNIFMVGDINIDIATCNTDQRSDDYMDLLAMHGLLPTHRLPTRGSSCLDHCFVKSNNKTLTIVCESSITDHDTVHLDIILEPSIKIIK